MLGLSNELEVRGPVRGPDGLDRTGPGIFWSVLVTGLNGLARLGPPRDGLDQDGPDRSADRSYFFIFYFYFIYVYKFCYILHYIL